MNADEWGHWCIDQVPTHLPNKTLRCPACGAIKAAGTE